MSEVVNKEDLAARYGDQLLFIDGHDSAFLGIVSRANLYVTCYDGNKIVQNLHDQGMTMEDAGEFFEFNIACAWLGEYTPAILERCALEEGSV